MSASIAVVPKHSLSTMPWIIQEQIARNANISTKLALRRSSKAFKKFIDKDPAFEGIHQEITLKLSQYVVEVRIVTRGGQKVKSSSYTIYEKDCVVKRDNEEISFVDDRDSCHVLRAVEDIMIILRDPDHRVRHLKIEEGSNEPDYEERRDLFCTLKYELGTLGHKVHAHRFSVFFHAQQSEILSVLPFLKPRVLEELDLDVTSPVAALLQTAQWEKAKTLNLATDFHSQFFNRMRHFETVNLSESDVTLAKFEFMTETFMGWLRYRSFKKFVIKKASIEPEDLDEIQDYLNPFPTPPNEKTPIDRVISFPNTVGTLRVVIYEKDDVKTITFAKNDF